MYSKAELEAKAHIELINIAKELGISRATRLEPQELIYKIIGLQSENPKALTKEQAAAGAQTTADPEARAPRQKRARIKGELLAESSMTNPALHRHISKAQQAKKQQGKALRPEAQNDQPKEPVIDEVAAANISINDLVLPEIPSIPDVVSPSGRWLRTTATAEPDAKADNPQMEENTMKAEEPVAVQAEGQESAQTQKRKRGRPRKNAETEQQEQKEEEKKSEPEMQQSASDADPVSGQTTTQEPTTKGRKKHKKASAATAEAKGDEVSKADDGKEQEMTHSSVSRADSSPN